MMFNSNLIGNYVIETAIGLGSLLILSIFTARYFTKSKKKITRIIDTIEEFHKSTVHMKNPDNVEEIVSVLMKGGASKLQIISDFDHTISRVHLNGTKCPTTYGILESSPFAPEENKYKANLLFEKYYPIEIDPHLTRAEKTPYMKEWYTESRSVMINAGIRKNDICNVVSAANAMLRDGCDILFQTLEAHNIPLLIFSAGIGDIIKEVLQQSHMFFSNMKIIANFMKFDDEENLVGFKGDLIHTFNKNQTSLENNDYFDHLKIRSNIILLGDNLGDIDMAEGAEYVSSILRIGFLNDKIEENLSKYLNAYDIVLADDQTMDLVNGLLQSIL